MKEIIKIISTNWVNLVMIFSSVYLFAFISSIVYDKFSIGEAFFGTTYAIVLYGLIFWVGYLVSIIILDVLFFTLDRRVEYLKFKLLIEWLIISIPFIYWIIKYNQWVFLIAIIAFLIGQFIRKPMILKIITA